MFLSEKIFLTSLTVTYNKFIKKETVSVTPRRFHTLSFRLSGKITVNGKLSDKNTLTYIPRGCGYDTEVIESGTMIVATFTLADEKRKLTPEIFVPASPEIFKGLFFALLKSGDCTKAEAPLGISYFYRILYEWERETENVLGEPKMPKRIIEAKDRIDREFSDMSLTVADLAEKAGVSEVYFRREFKEYVGLTPIAYIRLVRLSNAKALLKSGSFNVTETALSCGYDSPSYFSCDFRKSTGMTPKEYIKKYEQ